MLAGICILLSPVATEQLNKGGKERVKWEETRRRHGWAAGGERVLPGPTRRMLLRGQEGSLVGSPRDVFGCQHLLCKPVAGVVWSRWLEIRSAMRNRLNCSLT